MRHPQGSEKYKMFMSGFKTALKRRHHLFWYVGIQVDVLRPERLSLFDWSRSTHLERLQRLS